MTGVIEFKGQPLSKEQFACLKERWEACHTGVEKVDCHIVITEGERDGANYPILWLAP